MTSFELKVRIFEEDICFFLQSNEKATETLFKYKYEGLLRIPFVGKTL